MTKIISVLLSFLLSNHLYSQCPDDAGTDHVVCSNHYGNASRVTIGPVEPYPGAWSGLSFSWSPATGLNNRYIPNPTALPNESTTYTLTITGGSCGTLQYQATVKVAGKISMKAPNGSFNPSANYYYLYVPFEATVSLEMTNGDPNAIWGVYPDYWSNGNIPEHTGETFSPAFDANSTINKTYFVLTHDELNNECTFTDMPEITIYGVLLNQYPVTVINPYYANSSCGPTLPATITQQSVGTGGIYEWTLKGSNSGYWSITSPSGNSATLNHSGGTPPVQVDVWTRAYGPNYYGEVWMWYPTSYFTGSYPGCTPMTKKDNREANNLLLNSTAKLLPNPAKNSVVINSTNAIQRILIYNTAGVLVKQVAVNNANTVTVNTIGLSSGLYVVRIVSEKGVEEMKMIKE